MNYVHTTRGYLARLIAIRDGIALFDVRSPRDAREPFSKQNYATSERYFRANYEPAQ